MIEPQPATTSEPEGYLFQVQLQGKGASAPVNLNTRSNYTIARVSQGVLDLSFADDPGPTFQGGDGGGFGDTTAASNVAGWTVVTGAYTARSGAALAKLRITLFNSSFAVADLPATSTLSMQLAFKQAAPAE